MSLYIAIYDDLKSRETESLFFLKEKSWVLRSKKGKALSLASLGSAEEDALMILASARKERIIELEIALPSILDADIPSLLEKASRYLLDKDMMVGLLFDKPSLIEENLDAIKRFGITLPPLEKRAEPQCEFFELAARASINPIDRRGKKGALPLGRPMLEANLCCVSIADFPLEESFHKKLMRFLSKSSRSNAEIYRAGGISKQVFSKIISSPSLIPTKGTVICLAIGLRLNYEDAVSLLESAGYALSKSILFDAIILKYLKERVYDLDIINSELFERGCPLLGWHPREE